MKKYFQLCKKQVNFEFVLENVHDTNSQTRAVQKRLTRLLKAIDGVLLNESCFLNSLKKTS